MKDHLTRYAHDTLFDEYSAIAHEQVAKGIESLRDDPSVEAAIRQRIDAIVSEAVDDLNPSQPDQHFSSVYEFVTEFLAKMYPFVESRQRDVRWSPRWWAFPEAVARLSALWYRFEQLKQAEPATYLETFLRVHADYHMRYLMSEDSIFDAVKRDFEPSIPLPTDPMTKE